MINNEITLPDYAAKTRFDKHRIDIPFLNEEDIIPIGLDIGYSSTKVYSMFGKYIFPSLPIRASEERVLFSKDKDIMYKDMKGNVWFVGELARCALDNMEIQS